MRSEKDVKEMFDLYAAACDDGTAADYRECDAVRQALAWVLGDDSLDIPETQDEVDDEFDGLMDDEDEEEEDGEEEDEEEEEDGEEEDEDDDDLLDEDDDDLLDEDDEDEEEEEEW